MGDTRVGKTPSPFAPACRQAYLDRVDAHPSTLTSLFLGLARTPLLAKLVVMDLALNALAFLALQLTPPGLQDEVTLVSLCAILFLNAALVGWALRPLHALEQTTRMVARGDYEARTVMPWMADRNLVRIGSTLDALVDRVVADRARVRTLVAQVVAAGDQERAHIARELHDGTAQSLAALDMLLTATVAEVDRPETRDHLEAMQQIVGEALQEVRLLCQDVHPRVLDDLGLQAALASLIRRARARTEAEITLTTEGLESEPSREAGSVVYRVVQEALHNALKHARPTRVEVTVRRDAHVLTLEVADDGVGFDPEAVVDGGLGLFVMDERVSLVSGSLAVDSQPGSGTVVRATIPLELP